jgi:hypothetical protein
MSIFTQRRTAKLLRMAFLLLFVADSLPAATVGADVVWTTYQAEQGVTTGEKLFSRSYGDIANEAVDHACVKLSAANQQVTWKVAKPANAIVIRACVPDSPEGGGMGHTLSVAVNGTFRQKVTVSSAHTWLYGADPNGNDNKPGTGTPHAFFDEARQMLPGPPLSPGDSITVYKQASDNAPWYVIDLIDLELVGQPPEMPEGFLSVTEFGVLSDDGVDDSAALKACVEKARAEKKGVWFPPGLYHQTEPLVVDQVRVLGAGPWFTNLRALGKSKPGHFSGNVGFRLSGGDAQISGFSVEGTLTARSTEAIQHGVTGSGERHLVDNIWVRHTTTGGWIGPCSNVVVRRCRFHDTYADGLNFNNHSVDVLVEQNHCRGNGDDGLAVFSSTEKGGVSGACRNITLRQNSCEGQRWGNGVGVYGGDSIVVESNLITSVNRITGLTVSTGFASWPLSNVTIAGNVIIDCGGTGFNQKFPALYAYMPGKDISGLLIKGNVIRDATFEAIKVVATANGGVLEATISENSIESPGSTGIHIQGDVKGRLTLKNNDFRMPKDKAKLLNQSKPAQLILASDL